MSHAVSACEAVSTDQKRPIVDFQTCVVSLSEKDIVMLTSVKPPCDQPAESCQMKIIYILDTK